MRQQKRQLVTSDNHRTALRGTGTQRSHDRLGIERRNSAEWFVRNQHSGVACERHGQFGPTALAARERGWFRAQAIGDAKLHGDLRKIGGAAESVTRCAHLLLNGQTRQQQITSRNKKHAATCQIAE